MDFPADELQVVEKEELLKCFNGEKINEVYKGKTDYLVVFDDETVVKNLSPNFNEILKLNCRGIIVTSKANEVDFVSRFFGPSTGINEDPVTGSAHTSLMPYWANVLKNNKLRAKQLSERGGELNCELIGNRILISGQARTFLVGEIEV